MASFWAWVFVSMSQVKTEKEQRERVQWRALKASPGTEVVESPSLGMIRTHLGLILHNLLVVNLLWQGLE